MFFHTDFFKNKVLDKKNLLNVLSKSSPTVGIFIRELSNCNDQFLRLLGLPDFLGKHFW